MSKTFVGLGALGALSPVLMGAEGVPLPAGAPLWLPWLVTLLSPALLYLAGLGAKALVAAIRAKAKDEKNPVVKAIEESLADSVDSEAKKKGLE
jgi:hypothetical protein